VGGEVGGAGHGASRKFKGTYSPSGEGRGACRVGEGGQGASGPARLTCFNMEVINGRRRLSVATNRNQTEGCGPVMQTDTFEWAGGWAVQDCVGNGWSRCWPGLIIGGKGGGVKQGKK